MARPGAVLEIDRRHPPDLGQLLPERPPAPHRRPLAERPHRRDAALLERRRRPALARQTRRDRLAISSDAVSASIAPTGGDAQAAALMKTRRTNGADNQPDLPL